MIARNEKCKFSSAALKGIAILIALLLSCYSFPSVALANSETPLVAGTIEEQSSDDQSIDDYAKWKAEYVAQLASESNDLRSGTKDGISGYATSGYVSNSYIKCYTSSNGRFNIGTTADESLLYNFPYGDTSQTLIRVDSEDYIFDEYVTSVSIESGKSISTADIDGVHVIQEISLSNVPNSKIDNVVNIKYSCSSTTSKTVGIRIMLDTMLGSNDGAPFKVGTKKVVCEREYSGDAVPKTYAAFESFTESGLIATGYLRPSLKVKPSKVQFANWRDIHNSSWNYKIDESKSITGDSAVAVYFNERFIAGELPVLVAETSYGAYSSTIGNIGSSFDYDNNVPNKDLSIQCAKYAAFAYGSYRYIDTYGSYGLFYDGSKSTTFFLKESLAQDSFEDIKGFNIKQENEDGATFFLAHKKVSRNGTSRDLLLVVIRGTNGVEWKGNMNVDARNASASTDGYDAEHYSFWRGAKDLENEISNYTNDEKHKLNNPIVVITGHSRGGAIGNILARELTDHGYETAGVDSESVFAYLFAVPNADRKASTAYDNIYNFCFKDDFVPSMPLSEWGYGKNGTTIEATADEVEEKNKSFYAATEMSVALSESGRKPSFSNKKCEKVLSYVYDHRLFRVAGDYTWRDVDGYYTSITGFTNATDALYPTLYSFMHNLVAPAAMPDPGAPTLINAYLLNIFINLSAYQPIADFFVEGTHKRYSVNDTHQMYTYYNALGSGVFDGLFEQNNRAVSLRESNEASTQIKTSSENISADELAALKLIQQANRESFEEMGWNDEAPEEFDGITVNDGHIVEFNMDYANLCGSLDLSAFAYLTEINVSGNKLTSLLLPDPSSSTLRSLSCDHNDLTSLDVAGYSLEAIDCTDNYLDSDAIAAMVEGVCFADIEPQKIQNEDLYSSNDINTLESTLLNDEIWDFSVSVSYWPGITWEYIDGAYRVVALDISGCDLSGDIDFSNLTCLKSLDCSYNDLTSLNVSGCLELAYLNCSNNKLVELTIAQDAHFEILQADGNYLDYEVLSGIESDIADYGHQYISVNLEDFDSEETSALGDFASMLESPIDEPGKWQFAKWDKCDDGKYHVVELDFNDIELSGDLDLSTFSHLESIHCFGSEIESVVLPSGMESINDMAFCGCSNLKSVQLPSDLKSVGDKAFFNCDSLNMLVFPSTLETLGASAFAECDSLNSVYFTGDAPAIEESVFDYCAFDLSIFALEGTSGWDEESWEQYQIDYIAPTSVYSLPDKMTYYYGESVDASGLQLITVFDDGRYAFSGSDIEFDPEILNQVGEVSVLAKDENGSCYITVNVVQVSLSQCEITLDQYECQYTGSPIEPKVAVTYRGEVVDTSNYSVEYSNNTDIGNGTVTVVGKGFITGEYAIRFSIYGAYDLDDWRELESPHNYPDSYNCSWIFKASGTNVKSLFLTFDEQTMFEDYYDYVSVFDKDQNYIGEYTGDQLAGRTIVVPGNTVKLTLKSDGSVNEWGFKVKSLKQSSTNPADKPGWVKAGGSWYYYDADEGVLVSNKWMKDSKGWVYLGTDGAMVTNGWAKDSKGTCYMDASGHALVSSWLTLDGKTYYFDSGTHMVVSKWFKIDGTWYHFDANGVMEVSKWIKDSKGWCYVGKDGKMVTNGWAKDSKGWCYMDASGYAVASKWLKIDGKWYHFDANARMETSKWIKDSKGWCYVGANGAMVTNGWAKDSKGWCYMDADGYAIANQWKQIGDKWYYFDANARMVTGTQTINGKTYKFDDNGVWIN